MSEFVELRNQNPAFDELCDARDEVGKAIRMHQLSEDALQERLREWDHKIESMFKELTRTELHHRE
jgi:hypothetical protein